MGRGRRWGLGLVVSGILALAAVTCAAVAFGQVVSGLQFPGGDCLVYDFDGFCADERLTMRAAAEVLDVDDSNGLDTSPDGSIDGPVWVDVEFDTLTQHVVTDLEWPAAAGPVPRPGDDLVVAYDLSDPESLVAAADALAVAPDGGSLPPELSGPGTSTDQGSDDGRVAAALTAGFGLATVVAFLLTWWWAWRAPKPQAEPVAAPFAYLGHVHPGYVPPGYGYGYGYSGYSGYPGYGYSGGIGAGAPPVTPTPGGDPPVTPTPGGAPPSTAPAAGAGPRPPADAAGSAGNWPRPG